MNFIDVLTHFLNEKSLEGQSKDKPSLEVFLKDWLACVIAGMGTESFSRIVKVRKKVTGNSGFSVLDDPFLLAYAAHCLELDDSEFFGETHPSSVVFSSLFHQSRGDRTLQEILSAARLGFYSLVPLGLRFNPRHYASCWHGTGTCGALAATVANAMIADFNKEQLEMSLSVCSTLMGGHHAVFGTQAKYLNSARAAENGCLSTFFVREGLSSPVSGLSQESKIWEIFRAEKQFDPPLPITAPNLNFIKLKEYPLCHCLIPVAQHLLELKNDGVLYSVEKIKLVLSPYSYSVLSHKWPANREEAFFSSIFLLQKVIEGSSVDFVDFFHDFSPPKNCHATIEILSDGRLHFMDHEIGVVDKADEETTYFFPFDRQFKKQETSFLENKFEKLVSPYLRKQSYLENLWNLAGKESLDQDLKTYKAGLKEYLKFDFI